MNRKIKRALAISIGGLACLSLARLWFRRPLPSFNGACVVITGGARGLGLELARLWSEEGAFVAICSRTASEVEAAVIELRKKGYTAYGEVCDVIDPQQVKAFFQRVTRHVGPIDVLVNNAGIIQTGPVECMTTEDFRSSLGTHFWGPWHTISAVLPQMRKRRQGRIVNICSIGGKISVPHMVPYCAGKFALAGLSEGLRAELAAEGIVVTTIFPGTMRTGSPRNAEFKGRHRAEYAWFSIASALPGVSMDSTRAARRIIEACRRGAAESNLSLPVHVVVKGHALFHEWSAAVLELFSRALPSANGHNHASHKGFQSYSPWSPSWITALNESAAERNHETLSDGPMGRDQHSATASSQERVDEASADSFPASDAPAHTPITGLGRADDRRR